MRVEAGLDPDLAREVAVAEVDRDRAPDRQVHGTGGVLRHRPDDGHREAERVAAGQRAVHAGEGGPHSRGEPGRRLLHAAILWSAISSRAKRGGCVGHNGPQTHDAPLDGCRFSATAAPAGTLTVGVLPGRRRRPRRSRAALAVLSAVESGSDARFETRAGGAIGREAEASSGRALTEDVCGFCDEVFGRGGAVLAGRAAAGSSTTCAGGSTSSASSRRCARSRRCSKPAG